MHSGALCKPRIRAILRFMERDISLPLSMGGMCVHFVGVKGTGMAALVEILHRRGAEITGSDVAEVFYTDEIIRRCGVRPALFGAGNITDRIRLVIYSSAYNAGTNVELAEAVRRGIPCITYAQALGLLSEEAYSCGVCGVHGKTTTTGLAGTVLAQLDLPAQVLAGSGIASFGGGCTYSSPRGTSLFVAETCEYRRNFMHFSPKKIILTSVESDHQDFYPTYADIRDAFVDYACRLPQGGQLIYCADDAGASETARMAKARRADIQLLPYGERAGGSGRRVTFGAAGGGAQRFFVSGLGEFELRVPGRHLVLNAAAALALCAELLRAEGENPAEHAAAMRKGIAAFSGGRRRSEVTGTATVQGSVPVTFIDDYGHHPTAIRATLAGYREFYADRRIIVDFMSHTYTRTAALLEEFASAFAAADMVVLNGIYASAREDASASGVTGELLAEHTMRRHGNVRYCAEFPDAAECILSELQVPLPAGQGGFLVVTMGAGDNWKVGRMVQERLAPLR